MQLDFGSNKDGVDAAPELREKYLTFTDAIIATNKDGKACPMNAAKVQKFTILPYDFSVDGGELTPTLKTKRSVVDKTFTAQIDAMYASKDTYVNTLSIAGGGAAAE